MTSIRLKRLDFILNKAGEMLRHRANFRTSLTFSIIVSCEVLLCIYVEFSGKFIYGSSVATKHVSERRIKDAPLNRENANK